MRSVSHLDVEGKKVFVRVDYNLPMDDAGQITDDNRIVATLDLVKYLVDKKAKVILASHLGRPKNGPEKKFSLRPASLRLSQLLGKPVQFIEACVGPRAVEAVEKLEDGDILLLENLRFHPEEKKNDSDFAKSLAVLCDIYVNNAFAVSHRDQASVTGITRHAPVSAAGFLLEKEVNSYYDSIENPKRPLVALIGGAKVSSKLAALENMLQFVDKLIIGGAMANTFLSSQGIDTKASMVEKDLFQTAGNILEKAAAKGVEVLLPEDLIVSPAFDENSGFKGVDVNDIPDQWMALDIGPRTAERYSKALMDAATIVWNGPMGVFEMRSFMAGTQRVADAVAASSAYSIVGGGDTGLAAKRCKIADKVSYISTGGGAFLHMMEGKKLPGVAALED